MPKGVKGSGAPKAPKPAKAAAGHNAVGELDKGTFLEYRRLATHSLRALEEAQMAHASVLKRAKAAGIVTKKLMKVIRDARNPEVAQAELQAELKYRKWIGLPLGTQGDLLANDDEDTDDHLTDHDRTEQALFRADEQGYRAGRSGQNRVEANPYPAGTETHVKWDKAYIAGQAAIAAELGNNVTKITPSRGGDAIEAAKGPTKH